MQTHRKQTGVALGEPYQEGADLLVAEQRLDLLTHQEAVQ